jgi:NAD(P)-dependent dehydrogenase (short-subunit alcohol dehydrogenase family)
LIAAARPRAVLLTGGTGALGTAVTRRFLEDGHRVAATWLAGRESKDALIAELGHLSESLVMVKTDVTDPVSVEEAIREVAARLGRIDVLVHLVGGWRGGRPLHETRVEDWDRMTEINLRSAFLCCRGVLPLMLANGWGRIVLVSSRAALADRTGQGAYAVSKAGVGILAEAIAEETRGTAVTANCVAPSSLDTASNRAAMTEQDHSSLVPLADAAAIIAFLASEPAGQLRGATLPVFGNA